MVEPEPPAGLDPVQEGIRLFNEEYFFEAHEVLEDLWKREHGKSKLFLQGLIQICAAYHHFQNGNLVGAGTLLERGAQKMRSYPSDYLGIDAAKLLAHVDRDRERIGRMQRGEGDDKSLEFPRIERKIQ
ncbi:MAG TPA: DUF309 domain-containing protein [Thermoplasmata archaeon]|nr:DUF309 domain-containing protein [Thermoplasmata archaeon]